MPDAGQYYPAPQEMIDMCGFYMAQKKMLPTYANMDMEPLEDINIKYSK